MPITCTLSEDQETVTIKVAGRFDFSTHQDFQQTFRNFPRGEKSYVIDLTGTEYVDSAAVGMLLQLREYGRPELSVILVNGNQAVGDVLRIAKFGKLFTIK